MTCRISARGPPAVGHERPRSAPTDRSGDGSRGQGIISLISDPFGFGWDLFGTADRDVDFNLLSPTAISWVQASAIVVGHIAAAAVAHDRSLARFARQEAVRAQYPLLAAMVIFTVGGLFLLLGG